MHFEALAQSARTTSPDGTVIAYHRVGQGSSVVIVPGGLSTSKRWSAVAERLSTRHDVFVIDRRGRAESDVGVEPYALTKEVDDARTVLTVAGPGAAVLGHSFGGVVALELARLVEPGAIGRLMLYEPGVLDLSASLPTELAARLGKIAASADASTLLQAAMEKMAAAGAITVEERDATIALRPSPEWDELAAVAWTLPQEIATVSELGRAPDDYASLTVPTLLIAGESSESPHQRTCEQLTEVLPNAKLVRLSGQKHVAHQRDPEQLAAVIADYLAA